MPHDTERSQNLLRGLPAAVLLALALALTVATLTGCNEPDLYFEIPDTAAEPPGVSPSQQRNETGRGPRGDSPPDAEARTDLPASSGDAAPAALLAKGASCTSADACADGHCVDGVCCESACEGSCRRCDLPSAAGTCSAVPAGERTPPGRTACPTESPESCARSGLCDGQGECQLHPEGTVCGPAKCEGTTNVLSSVSKCDGKGKCLRGSDQPCAPFKCSASATCATTCSTANDCVSAPCVNGSCGKVDNGAKCTGPDVCKSGFCVDGVCCDGACQDQCASCNLAGTEGKCSPLKSGQPVGGRKACDGSGTCGGRCNGTTTCSYPPTSTSCGAAKCTNARETAEAFCDGKGKCSVPAAKECTGGFACSGARCASNCEAPDRRCQSGFICMGDRCVRQKDLGATCSADAQCKSNVCKNDFKGVTRCCEKCELAGSQCNTDGKCKRSEDWECDQRSDCLDGLVCIMNPTTRQGYCTKECGEALDSACCLDTRTPTCKSSRSCVNTSTLPGDEYWQCR
jgi:hypothetical protein